MNKLVNEQSRLTRGTQEYVEAGKKIRILDGILQQHRQQLHGVSKSWSFEGMAHSMNKYFLAVSTFVAGFGSLLYSGKKAITMFAEFDDKVSDVQKTTNLSKDSVYAMNEQLKKLDTRTAQEELLDLGRIAGKLNIKNQQEVEGFIKASDKVVVALKEDLGGDAEEAVRQIGKLVSVFGVREEFGIEESITKVGSAINELGMSSTANEGYIVEFTKRVAGVAPTAKISIQDVMGLAATLDHLGQTSEVSSTAYSQVITGMFKDTPAYAKAARMSVKDFSELLNKDANQAFIKLLEGLNNNDAGLQALISSMGDLDMEGKRAISVIGVLANNVGILKEQQSISNREFQRGTSLQQEFNVKNNNAQAELEKRRKVLNNLAIDLGQKLMPVLTASTSGFSYFVKAVSVLTDFTIKHWKAILVTTSALAAYTIAAKIAAMWQARQTKETIASTVALHAKSIALGIAKGATLLLSAAKALLTGNIMRASAAMRLFNMTLKANPIGLVLSLVILLGGALYSFITRTKEATSATNKLAEETSRLQKEKVEQISQEKNALNSLVSQITQLNEKSALRKKLIQELQQAYPDFIGNIDAEKISNKQLAEQLAIVNKAYGEKAKLAALSATSEAVQKKMTENEIRMLEIEEERKKKLEEKEKRKSKPSMTIANQYGQTTQVYQGVDDLDKEMKELDKEYEQLALENKLREAQLLKLDQKTSIQRENIYSNTVEWWQRKVAEYKTGIEAFKQEIDKANALGEKNMSQHFTSKLSEYEVELKIYEAKLKEAQEKAAADAKALADENAPTPPTPPDKGKWTLNNDINFLRESLKLKKAFAKGEIKSREEFDRQFLKLEINTLTSRINLRKESGQDILDLQNELANKHMEKQSNFLKQEQELDNVINDAKPKIEKEIASYNQQLLELGLYGLKKKNMTKKQLAAFEALESSHQMRMNKLDAEAMTDELENKQRKFNLELSELKLKNAEELSAITTLEAAKEKLSSSMDLQELNKIRTLAQAKKLLKKQNALQEQELQKKYLEDLLKTLQQTIDSGQFGELNLSDTILSEEEKEVILKRLAEAREALAGLMNPNNGNAEDNEELLLGNTDILGFSVEDWETFYSNLENGKNGIQELALAVQALGQVWSSYYDYVNAAEQKKLQQYETGINKQKESLQQSLDHNLISQEAYDKKVEILDKDLDKKKAELEYRAAVRARNIAVMEAIVNTALAVTSALTVKPPLGIALAAIVGAMGALQVGAILSTPLPEVPGKEEGGYLDVTRQQDGKKFRAKKDPAKRGWVSTPTVITGESGLEYVMPDDATKNPTIKPILDILEMARMDGSLATLNLPAILQSNLSYSGRQSGGYVSNVTVPSGQAPTAVTHQDPALLELLKANTAIMQQLASKLENPIKAEVALYGRRGIYEKMEEGEKLNNNVNL